ncbi:MAG: hypothetical protein OQK79_05465, partial [Rhodanobacter sp.]|nr:hypothetical protein [Rhodanobacter sp.]
DFTRFDWLLAMDGDNLAVLHQRCPSDGQGRFRLFLDAAGVGVARPVPDPYQGELADFRAVLRLAEQGVDGLLKHLQQARAGQVGVQDRSRTTR